MGGVDGKAGAWAYPEGGMGGVSDSIASSGISLGVQIFTDMVHALHHYMFYEFFHPEIKGILLSKS